MFGFSIGGPNNSVRFDVTLLSSGRDPVCAETTSMLHAAPLALPRTRQAQISAVLKSKGIPESDGRTRARVAPPRVLLEKKRKKKSKRVVSNFYLFVFPKRSIVRQEDKETPDPGAAWVLNFDPCFGYGLRKSWLAQSRRAGPLPLT